MPTGTHLWLPTAGMLEIPASGSRVPFEPEEKLKAGKGSTKMAEQNYVEVKVSMKTPALARIVEALKKSKKVNKRIWGLSLSVHSLTPDAKILANNCIELKGLRLSKTEPK